MHKKVQIQVPEEPKSMFGEQSDNLLTKIYTYKQIAQFTGAYESCVLDPY